jgi:hypothetical protein
MTSPVRIEDGREACAGSFDANEMNFSLAFSSSILTDRGNNRMKAVAAGVSASVAINVRLPGAEPATVMRNLLLIASSSDSYLDAAGAKRGNDTAVNQQVGAGHKGRIRAQQVGGCGGHFIRRTHTLRGRRVDQGAVTRANVRS